MQIDILLNIKQLKIISRDIKGFKAFYECLLIKNFIKPKIYN